MTAATETRKRNFKLSKIALTWWGIALAFGVNIALFLLLRGGNGSDPIFLRLGNLQFRWYGIIVTAGVLVAILVAQFLAERRGDDSDHLWRLLPIVLISGLIFSRVWYVIFTWSQYKDSFFSFGDPVRAGALEIWRGGTAIHGAVIGGMLGALVYSRFAKNFNFWRFADYAAPGLALALVIGRWGNFFNNEAYGRETKLFWGIKVPCDPLNNYRTTGAVPGTVDLRCPPLSPNAPGPDALFHPVFLYESLWCYFCFLVVFFVIMKPKTVERRFKVRPRNGDAFLLFCVLYSVGRFFIESLRTDSLFLDGTINSLRIAQVFSVLVIIGGGYWLFYRHRQPAPDTEALSMRVSAKQSKV